MLPPLIILDVQDAINQPVWDGKNNPSYIDAIERLYSALLQQPTVQQVA